MPEFKWSSLARSQLSCAILPDTVHFAACGKQRSDPLEPRHSTTGGPLSAARALSRRKRSATCGSPGRPQTGDPANAQSL